MATASFGTIGVNPPQTLRGSAKTKSADVAPAPVDVAPSNNNHLSPPGEKYSVSNESASSGRCSDDQHFWRGSDGSHVSEGEAAAEAHAVAMQQNVNASQNFSSPLPSPNATDPSSPQLQSHSQIADWSTEYDLRGANTGVRQGEAVEYDPTSDSYKVATRPGAVAFIDRKDAAFMRQMEEQA